MKKVVSIVIALIVLTSITLVQAADEKNLSLASDKTEITKGEKVEITISSNELTGIEGTLKFESKDWTLEGKSSDNSFTLNEETGKFALANISGEEKISAKIILKSKEDTTSTSSTINITGITGSDKSGAGYEISDKSVTIKFKTTSSGGTTNNTINNKSTNEYKEIPVKSQDKEMPKTGAANIFIGITIFTVASSALYIEYKKNNF